jgi:site-specific DNA recombinase
MIRCAIYARYSSDLQRDTSIDDQVRKCREHATRQGWKVISGGTYTDEGLSGTSAASRPGLQQLLRDAEQSNAAFDRVLLDDTSRLARNLPEALTVISTLQFHRVEVSAISQGLDSAHESSRQMFTLHGLMDEQFIKGLGDKVRRGQEGQVLKGRAHGGRVFGYDNVAIEDPTRKGEYGRPFVVGVERKINPQQASIVTRIFEAYASGKSLLKVAQDLNGDGIPTPRASGWGNNTLWHQSSIKQLLCNETYRGLLIFNRRKNVRNPKTGAQVARWQPDERWIRVVVKEMRIISDKLWDQVHDRRKAQREAGKAAGGWGKNKGKNILLFSGLLYCGECGRRMVIIRTREHFSKYGCPAAFKWAKKCKNDLMIRDTRIAEQIVEAIEEKVLDSKSIQFVISQFEGEVTKRLKALKSAAQKSDNSKAALKREKSNIQDQIERVTEAIIAAGHSKALLSKLADLEEQMNNLAVRMETVKSPDVSVTIGEIQRYINSAAAEIRKKLRSKDQIVRRQLLLSHIERITLTPVGKGAFEAVGTLKINVGNAHTRINTGGNSVQNASQLCTVLPFPLKTRLELGEDFVRDSKTGRIKHIG